MILTFDLGNSKIHLALFDGDSLIAKFCYPNTRDLTVEDLAVALENFLRQNYVSDENLFGVACSSVDPRCFEILKKALRAITKHEIYVVESHKIPSLRVRYDDPKTLGNDRAAAALAAVTLFPNKNILLFDLGTATTASVITSKREFLGGWIVPGIRTSLKALHSETALLPEVEFKTTNLTAATSTAAAIQSGLFLQTYYYLQGLKDRVQHSVFLNNDFIVIATGGWSEIFAKDSLFDHCIPNLTLRGVKTALLEHQNTTPRRIYETHLDESKNTQSHSDRSRSSLRRVDLDRSQAV